jgi:hypothetical protein
VGTQVAVPFARGSSVKKKRRRFKQEQLAERLAEEARRLRAEARSVRPGTRRTELLRQAEQAESGVQMAKWLGASQSTEPPP